MIGNNIIYLIVPMNDLYLKNNNNCHNNWKPIFLILAVHVPLKNMNY